MEGLAQVDVVAAGVRIHRAELGVGERPGEREQAADEPSGEDPGPGCGSAAAIAPASGRCRRRSPTTRRASSRRPARVGARACRADAAASHLGFLALEGFAARVRLAGARALDADVADAKPGEDGITWRRRIDVAGLDLEAPHPLLELQLHLGQARSLRAVGERGSRSVGLEAALRDHHVKGGRGRTADGDFDVDGHRVERAARSCSRNPTP